MLALMSVLPKVCFSIPVLLGERLRRAIRTGYLRGLLRNRILQKILLAYFYRIDGNRETDWNRAMKSVAYGNVFVKLRKKICWVKTDKGKQRLQQQREA